MTRKSYPGGAAPYSAALISLSVPSTPTRRTLTRTPRPFGTSSSDGFASSARWTVPGMPGLTAIAFIGAASAVISIVVEVCDFIELILSIDGQNSPRTPPGCILGHRPLPPGVAQDAPPGDNFHTALRAAHAGGMEEH